MNIAASKLPGLVLVSLQSNEPIAQLKRPVLDPDKLEVVGFVCQVPGESTDKLLVASDIRQFASNCLIIDSADDLVETTDVIRLRPLLTNPYTLVGKPVSTTLGRHLGVVQDYKLDPLTFAVQQLVVAKISVLPPALHRHLVHRNQISELQPNRIIVTDTTEAEPLVLPGLGSIPT